MPSIAAKEVAREVLETVRKGKKPNLGKIIKSKGYALTTSTVPTQVTNTISYQEEISPVVKRLERERERIVSALEGKNLTKERYQTLIDGLDKITKNVQLLSGKATGNIAVIPITNVFSSISHEENSETEETD